MGNKSVFLSVQDAIDAGRKLKNAGVYLRLFDRVVLGKTLEMKEIPEDRILELRFFNRDQEIRIYRDGDQLNAIRVRDGDYPDFIDSRHKINPQFGDYSLVKRQYIDFDEDGQAYPVCTRFLELEEL